MKSRFHQLVPALQAALAEQPGGLALRMAEEDALLSAAREGLSKAGLGSLSPLLASAHRSNPRTGLRGSELVVVTNNHSAAARLRMAAPTILDCCRARGLGFQTVKFRAMKATAALARPVAESRPAIPSAARSRLLAALNDES